ncbi:hypothetical protein WR25_02446 isoform B [Diploscapter pachys]|uniref:Cytochrome P450 n=1 Tax=Diploscapter pachys TaxID=2018661 RepID=A0A2A2KKS0_9BILA|nr:hypothetical protein WR25_02446 isoform B [Diploscapter pachys]
MFVRNGDEWYRLRSAVQQIMMRPQAVYAYLPFTNQVTQSLINHIKNETQRDGQVDMRRVAGRWSLESAGNTVFEKRLGALGDNIKWADRLVDVNKEIFQLSARMKFGFPFYRYFKMPQWKRMIELEDTFYAEADKLMDEAIEKLQSKENPENLLFASCLINKPELNKRDIKVIMLSLFADGLSTTAPMFVYNLFNIAIHKDIQERLRKEINEAVGKDEAIDVAHLQKMPLLRACVKETFRFFPIGTEISRIPTKDVVLSGYLVPAGTPIDINTNVLMTSPKFFSDPLKFKPERWLRENEKKEQAHPFAILPFGFGPRMCAGRRFAEQDLHVTLAKLVQSFDIDHKHEPIRQIYETLLLPAGDCRFHMKPL